YNRTTGNVILYHNGVQAGSGTINNANLDSSSSFCIGEAYWEDFIHGIMDEVRVSNIVRSPNWISTCYENQKDPSKFYSISGRYEVNPPKPKDFNFYKVITIDHNKVTGSHKDFPLLISILDSDLRVQVQSNGNDIAFYNGSIWLQHEIEYFNQSYNPTFAKLVAWVRIPYISDSDDTIIYMYYGNSSMTSRQDPSGVWDNNYKGVWHLSEVPTGTSGEIKDSTAINDGTSYGSMSSTNQITGQIDGSIDFDGTDDYISCGDTEDIIDEITIEAWIWLAVASKADWPTIVGKSNEYRLYHDSDRDGYITFYVSTTSGYRYTGEYDLPIQTWLHVVGTYDGSSSKIYIDGSVENTDSHTGTIVPTTNDLRFARKAGSTYFDGSIDEVRISNIARSAEWISTCYENQNDPDNFYSISEALKTYIPSFEDFAYYKEITIDHTKVSGTGSHMNFPLLISILDEDLHDDVQLDGDDIAFSNGTEWIDHEIEVFKRNYDSTRAQLIAWVRVPSLSTSTNTKIYMYYGNSNLCSQENPTGVWDANHKGIWHLAEQGGGTLGIEDSTSNSNDGTDYSGVSFNNVGQVAKSVGFNDASNQRIQITDDTSLHISDQLTVEAWINPTKVDEWISIVSKMDGDWNSQLSSNEDLYSAVDNNGRLFIGLANSGSYYEWTSDVYLSAGTWQHIVFTYNSSTSICTAYKNGDFEDSQNFGLGTLATNTRPLYIGFNRGWIVESFDGTIDEVRISNTVRSAEWIKTEFNNQKYPNTFYSVGSEQTGFSNIQVNAIDSYGNPIPNVNVAILNSTEIKYSSITNNDGYALFTNIPQNTIDGYNFTVNMTSNIEPFQTVTINYTSEAIKIEDPFHNITLICNASRNIFTVEDVDGVPLDSGSIIVSKGTQELQNCTLDATGHATFWWLNTTGYSYKVWYQDIVYDPNPIVLKADV
ncbi:MAG: DUF2341 domain-containing protein, partial [Promethearchaeota archaeon]